MVRFTVAYMYMRLVKKTKKCERLSFREFHFAIRGCNKCTYNKKYKS